jgi:SAM-dependent methyltransferase
MIKNTPSPFSSEIRWQVKKVAPELAENAAAIKYHLLFARQHLGANIPPGARILDFGCGVGDTVKLLLDLGYDAVGIDVREYWGADHEIYWKTGPLPDEAVCRRLSLVPLSDYRLPYPDHSIDFCFSDQVFEHVFDYETPFRELARVLKTGAVSVHRFPGPNRLMEEHLRLPFPRLCYYESYLKFCSILRSITRGGAWHEHFATLQENMRYNNYPSKSQLRRYATSAGVHVEFREDDEFLLRGGGRFKNLIDLAKGFGLDRVLAFAAKPILQRYMVLRATA